MSFSSSIDLHEVDLYVRPAYSVILFLVFMYCVAWVWPTSKMCPSRSVQRPLNLTWLVGLGAGFVVVVFRLPRYPFPPPRRLLYLVHGAPPVLPEPLVLDSSDVFVGLDSFESLDTVSIAVVCESFRCPFYCNMLNLLNNTR